uniref:Zinc knuckle domain-containing protein n=1 Tax=Myotis lucifugus TaxID=59463 RepID=G1Q423_MYOLU
WYSRRQVVTQNERPHTLMAQKGKQPQRAPVAREAPPPEEENPRVRCWKCGAFGHKASSLTCPMKRNHWNRSPAPQAMGANKTKENLKPWNPQVQLNPGPFRRADRVNEQRAWHEEQRQAPCWRLPWRPTCRPQQNWKEETETCDYVRDPHMQRPDHNTKRKYVRDPDLTPWAPKRKRVMTSSAPPVEGVVRSACLPPVPKNGQEGPVTDSPHAEGTHLVQDPTHSIHEGDNRPHSAFSNQGLDQALIHQPQAKSPDRNSHSIQHAAAHSVGQDSDFIIKVPGKRAAQTSSQTCQMPTKKPRLSPSLNSTQRPDLLPQHQGPPIKTLQPCQFPPILEVLGQSLRNVFTTLDKGQWSSMCLTPPSLPPAQIPPTTEKSEALCPCVPLSVLLEALQLSSSSEERAGQFE